MKYIDDVEIPIVELSRRNLTLLLAKLDDPLSAATLLAPGNGIYVRAVEDDEHYSEREPGEMFMPTSGVTV